MVVWGAGGQEGGMPGQEEASGVVNMSVVVRVSQVPKPIKPYTLNMCK